MWSRNFTFLENERLEDNKTMNHDHAFLFELMNDNVHIAENSEDAYDNVHMNLKTFHPKMSMLGKFSPIIGEISQENENTVKNYNQILGGPLEHSSTQSFVT